MGEMFAGSWTWLEKRTAVDLSLTEKIGTFGTQSKKRGENPMGQDDR